MDDVKQSLLDQKNIGDGLREVQLHHGWSEVVTILTDLYKENVAILILKDDLEARAMLKAIEHLTSSMQVKIDYGKVATEELKSEKFKNMQATP